MQDAAPSGRVYFVSHVQNLAHPDDWESVFVAREGRPFFWSGVSQAHYRGMLDGRSLPITAGERNGDKGRLVCRRTTRRASYLTCYTRTSHDGFKLTCALS
jgi:hypothetical protein